MITEIRREDRRYDRPDYEPFWAAAAALGLPLSLHAATRRQGRIRGGGDKTLRDASSRATKAFYPALSLCDLIFSGVFERHPHLTLAIVEFELAGRPTCSRRWNTPIGSITARRFTGSRACPREGGGRRGRPERVLPPQRGLELPGGRHRHPPPRSTSLFPATGRVQTTPLPALRLWARVLRAV